MGSRALCLLASTLFLVLVFACSRGVRSSEGPFEPAAITLKESGHLKELVDEALTFRDPNNVEWSAPKGTLTDGASVPRLLLPITDGRWDAKFLKAAVLHDCYCQTDNEDRCQGRYRSRPWQEVHRMFYDACLAGGTPSVVAGTMYAGVWLGGPRWNDPAPSLEDAPAELVNLGFTAVKAWILKNDPTIQEIEADLEQREPLLLELHRRDLAISAAIREGNFGQAQQLLDEQEQRLEGRLETSPDDLMLLNFRGYLRKDSARLYRESGMEESAAEALRESQESFAAILRAEPREPIALKGMANVSMMRGDLIGAEGLVLEALEVAPDYEAAAEDLEAIEGLREAQTPP